MRLTRNIFVAILFSYLLVSLCFTSCYSPDQTKSVYDIRKEDSLRRLDSILESITPENILIKDEYRKQLFDTLINEVELSFWQYSDVFYLNANYTANPQNTDTVAKNYYYAVISIKNTKKGCKTNYNTMLNYYNYGDGDYYLERHAFTFFAPITKHNKFNEYELPMWHLQTDTMPETELAITCKFYVLDSTTYKATTNLFNSHKKFKLVGDFNKKFKLRNYKYYIKEFTLDSLSLVGGSYDFGLFGTPDLYYKLHTHNNRLKSSMDNQYREETTTISNIYLFLTHPKGSMVLKFYDEDMMYDDFLGGFKFNYSQRDSSYALKFDTIHDNTDIKKVKFSLKEVKQ